MLFLCSNPQIQELFAKLLGKDKPDPLSGYLLALLSGLFIIFVYSINYNEKKKEKNREDFLFKVSDFNPKASGLYFGKPTPFQFDRIGCTNNYPVGGNNDMITNNMKSIKPYCEYCKTKENSEDNEYINKNNVYGIDYDILNNYKTN
jgi:hypothetical protein